MATATKKQADVVYVLELSTREANALCELLIAANFYEGEGPLLDGIYTALVRQGAEMDNCEHKIVDKEVVVTRGDG